MNGKPNNLYDVLIVGGGPAGSTCAWKLKDSGLNVLLIDKASFPRDKTCAGWITPSIVNLLDISTEDYSQHYILQPISGFRTGVIGRSKTVQTIYDKTVSYGIRRCEFDHYLLKKN